MLGKDAISVLIADDDPEYARFIGEILGTSKNQQFTVAHVTHLGQILQALKARKTRVLLLDIHLPDGNGLEWLRLHRAHVQAAVVIMTGNPEFDGEEVAPGAQDFLLSLASWAHSNRSAKQSILLLIDDLETMAKLDFDALQNFRWLLLRGPARRVWPIVTMNAGRYGQVLSWIPNFRTRIFGRIENGRVAGALGGDNASALDKLEAGIQFSLRENENWLRFWLPSC